MCGDGTFTDCTLPSLTLAGADDQKLNGTLHVQDLTFENTAGRVSVGADVSVSGTLKNKNTALHSGQKVKLLAGGKIDGSVYHGALTLDGASIPQSIRFDGDLYTTENECAFSSALRVNGSLRVGGPVRYDKDVTVQGSWQTTASGLTQTFASGASMTVGQDVNLQKATLSGLRTLRCGGDWTAPELTAEHLSLTLDGAVPQSICSETALQDLLIENTGKTGVSIQKPVTVSGTLRNRSTHLTGGENLTLLSTGTIDGDSFHGSLRVQDYEFTADKAITGDLYADGSMTVASGTVTASGGFRHTDEAPLTVAKDAALHVAGITTVQNTALQLDGTLQTGSDCLLTTTTLSGSGTLRAHGDLTLGGESACGTLELCGKLPQTVSGSALQVGTLRLNNTSRQGITLDSALTVTETYESNGGPCTQGSGKLNLDLSKLNTASMLLGDVHLTEPTTLKDRTVTIDGTLWLDGASLTLENATLIVRGSLRSTGTGCALTIDAGSALQVRNLVQLSGTALTADGALTIGGDCVLTGGSLTGAGEIAFGGDLYSGTAAVTLAGAARFDGRLAQRVSGSSLQFASLTFSNPSRSGVWLLSTVNYSGTLTTGQTRINNAERLVQK